MPLYEYQCPVCGTIKTDLRPVARCDEPGPVCSCCERPTQKIVSLPRFKINIFDAYESPVSGRIIRTAAERDRDLKESGCRPWMGLQEEKQEAARCRAAEQLRQEQGIENAVVEALQQLPESHRRALDSYVPGAPDNLPAGEVNSSNTRVYSVL